MPRIRAHLNVAVNAGEYAWKPVIVADVIDRARAAGDTSDVLWADAGCFFHALQPIADRIRETRRTVGADVGGRHAGVDAPADVRVPRCGSRASTASGATRTRRSWASPSAARPPSAREAVYREIVLPWKTCALAKDCIAPAGSSRKNHRQDQAVLSYLVHRAGYAFAEDTWRDLGVRTKCDRWFYHYIGFDVPACVYARTCLS